MEIEIPNKALSTLYELMNAITNPYNRIPNLKWEVEQAGSPSNKNDKIDRFYVWLNTDCMPTITIYANGNLEFIYKGWVVLLPKNMTSVFEKFTFFMSRIVEISGDEEK